MKQLYLIDNKKYTFNIYNDYFGHREVIVVDENNIEIVDGIINTWAFKSGREYTGNVTRNEKIVYAEGTKKQIQKIRIEFTPQIGYNISGNNIGYLKGRTGSDLLKEFKVYGTQGKIVNPNQEKFIVVFSRAQDLNYNSELKNLFLNSMMPAGLIPKERFDTTVVGEFTYTSAQEFEFMNGSDFNFIN